MLKPTSQVPDHRPNLILSSSFPCSPCCSSGCRRQRRVHSERHSALLMSWNLHSSCLEPMAAEARWKTANLRHGSATASR